MTWDSGLFSITRASIYYGSQELRNCHPFTRTSLSWVWQRIRVFWWKHLYTKVKNRSQTGRFIMHKSKLNTAQSELLKTFLKEAESYFAELLETANNAPDGAVFEQAEDFVSQSGVELLRASLQKALQAQDQEVEKKG